MPSHSRFLRSPLAFAAVATMLLPVLVVALVLWQNFSTQIEDSYQKRLITSLNFAELILSEGIDDFRGALSRLAADNTLQITVDLDIRPQLRRYLDSQFKVSEFAFASVTNVDGVVISSTAQPGIRVPTCSTQPRTPTESLITQDDRLLLVRAIPLDNKTSTLGHVCAGFALNGAAISALVSEKIDGQALIGWDGKTFALHTNAPSILMDFSNQTIPDNWLEGIHHQGAHFHGVTDTFSVGQSDIQFGVLVDMAAYESGQRQSLLIIVTVVFAVLLLTAFGVRMFGLRRKAEEQLSMERGKAVVTLASIADGVVTTDQHGNVTYANPAAGSLLHEKAEDLLGVHLYDALELTSESTGERLLDLESLANSESVIALEDAVLAGRSGSKTPVHFSVAPIKKGALKAGSVITFRDVHRERELRRRLAWKASRDDLTGLLNRSEFRRELANNISKHLGQDEHHCLLYIDLDEFKVVNDTCGHRAGDDLLRQVSASLLGLLRQSDTVARLGGDEFGVLLQNCSRDRGLEIAEQIIEIINDKRFHYQERVFHVGASIGLVSITRETNNLEDLMSTVDAACYVAKERGRNRVFVDEVDSTVILHRMDELSQASHVRQAIKENRLVLYRQSIVSTANPNPALEVHAEVLVRMKDDDGTLVAPGAFIPIAERHGMMQEIDRWVVRELFELEGARLRQWKPGGAAKDFVYSVNLSGASLTDSTFLDFVREELLSKSIPGGAVAFEITETQIITHLDKAVAFITALKGLGCRFLLDDFGSGMSSFGYLKHLPVDYLKIDGLFVKDILSDPIDRAMVKMINEIGHTMGLITIAEFVENPAILEHITKLGVDMAQGYGVHKPEELLPSTARLQVVEA